MHVFRTAAVTLATAVCLAPAASAQASGSSLVTPHSARLSLAADSGGNSDLGFWFEDSGQFSEGANPGGANAYRLLYGWPDSGDTSFSTIRVDGADSRFGSESPTNTSYGNGTQTVDSYGGVQVTQRVTAVSNPATGRPDTALISYTLRNTSSSTHTAGVRVMLDTMIGDNDGAPFRVPGTGPVTTTKTWSGGSVPNSFLVFHNLDSTDQVGEARFTGSGLTKPDTLKSAYWRDIRDQSDLWNYDTTGSDMTADTAFAAYYNPVTLAPGASRTVAFTYGVGDATANTQGALAAGLSGPSVLQVQGSRYTPDPFDVVGTINNSGTSALRNVRVRLTLPPELQTSSTNPVTVGTVPTGGSDKQVTWQVHAVPQPRAKTVSYSITVSADGVADKRITRTVQLPVVPGATSPTSPTSGPTSPTSGPTSPTSGPTSGGGSGSTSSGSSTLTGPPVITDGPADNGSAAAGVIGSGLLIAGAASVAAARLRRRR